jgi:hypothetical protein
MITLKSAHFYGLSTISKVIQNQTGPYSHSAVYIDDAERLYIKTLIGEERATKIKLDQMNLMEQWPHSGRIKSWMDYNDMHDHTSGTPYEIWALNMSRLDWEYCLAHYVKSCEDKKEYDWAGIVNFRYKFIKEDPEKTFCSEELITPIVKALKWSTVRPWTVHPTLCVNLIQAAGGFIIQQGET